MFAALPAAYAAQGSKARAVESGTAAGSKYRLGGPDTKSLGGPDTKSLGGPDTKLLGGPDTKRIKRN